MERHARRGHKRGSRRFAASRAQRKGKERRSVLWAGPERRAHYAACSIKRPSPKLSHLIEGGVLRSDGKDLREQSEKPS